MKSIDISEKSSSGFSYMDHMILPASIAEPPPMAMMQSGSKARSSSSPFWASCSLGSGEMDQKLECAMPIWSSFSSIFLVKPDLYRKESVTMKARFLWYTVPSSSRATGMQPFLK